LIGLAVSLVAIESVDLGCHDEIVLVQSLDLLGTQGNGRVTPPERNVWMMAFSLGEHTDLLNKG
jgi:hypothetical protein